MSGRAQRSQARLTGAPAIFSAELELTADFELPERPTTASGRPFDEARVLVRVGAEPVGFLTLPLGERALTRESILKAIQQDLDGPVKAELTRHKSRASQPRRGHRAKAGDAQYLAPIEQRSVSVIVCTRNRADALDRCLQALSAIDHDALTFIIVDNAPSDASTRELVASLARNDARMMYIREPRPGLSYARNCGLAHATSEIVAYTDDDVRVDPLWVKGLLRGFQRGPHVACVTGLVASASLELAVEQYFDARVSWSSSCETRLYDAHRGAVDKALHPYAAGAFGTGANFSFRTDVLRELGEFDESLGAGSPSAGGEDLDIFVRMIRAGYAISYEPAALVWHEHRADDEALRRQMYAYGKALSAFLYKYASSRGTALDMMRRVLPGMRRIGVLGTRSRQAGTPSGLARKLMLAEMRGFMAGPLAYERTRRIQDPDRRRAVAP
jgi:glycosyltransferase involved in cell wall biosynthesis